MIIFSSPEKLVDFLKSKLSPKVQENLFYSTYSFEHKGIERQGRTWLKPIPIIHNLQNSGFAFGITEDPQMFHYPEKFILLWTKLSAHLEKSDNLSYEQEKFKLISINQACDILQVSRPTVYKLINEQHIPYVNVLNQKRIQLNDLLDFIKKNKNLKL